MAGFDVFADDLEDVPVIVQYGKLFVLTTVEVSVGS